MYNPSDYNPVYVCLHLTFVLKRRFPPLEFLKNNLKWGVLVREGFNPISPGLFDSLGGWKTQYKLVVRYLNFCCILSSLFGQFYCVETTVKNSLFEETPCKKQCFYSIFPRFHLGVGKPHEKRLLKKKNKYSHVRLPLPLPIYSPHRPPRSTTHLFSGLKVCFEALLLSGMRESQFHIFFFLFFLHPREAQDRLDENNIHFFEMCPSDFA